MSKSASKSVSALPPTGFQLCIASSLLEAASSADKRMPASMPLTSYSHEISRWQTPGLTRRSHDGYPGDEYL